MLSLIFVSHLSSGQSFIPACCCSRPSTASTSSSYHLFGIHSRTAHAKVNVRPLYYSSSSDDLDQQPIPLSAREIRQELESYGIDTRSFFEKTELVEVLKKARAERSGYGGVGFDGADERSTSASPSSSESREEQIKRKMEKYNTLSISELKRRLEDQGIATKAFLEKSEFIKALAEARAYDPDFRDVNAERFEFDPCDPRMNGLIDIGQTASAPRPRDRYVRDAYAYNDYGREEAWEGREGRWASAHQERQAASGAGNSSAPPPPPRPPPDEYQKRYEAGSSTRVSSGQVPFTERNGRNGSGSDSGWWDRPYEARRRSR